METNSLYIKRKNRSAALIIWVAALLVLPGRTGAQTIEKASRAHSKIIRGESVKDIIKRAQQLTLKREREAASKLLVSAIQEQDKGAAAVFELQKALTQQMAIFYSEKAQQIFELAETFFYSDLNGAIEKLKESAKIEEGNTAIQLELARAYLRSGDCKAALSTATAAKALDPYGEAISLVALQSNACLQEVAAVETALIKEEKSLRNLGMYLNLVRAQVAMAQSKTLGKMQDAQQFAEKARQQDSNFAETYYWLGEIDRAGGVKDSPNYQKYVLLCKGASVATYKKYKYEPRLCMQTKEVQQWITKEEQK